MKLLLLQRLLRLPIMPLTLLPLLPLTLLALLLPITVHLFWPFLRHRLLQAALIGGAVFIAVGGALYAAAHVAAGETEGDVIAGFILPLLLAWVLAMPLLKLRLTEGRWTGPYPTLFDLTWRGALTLAEAALFTGVFWLLMGLAGVLFGLLDIDAVGDVISDPRFVFPATALVGTIAIHLIGASAEMIDGLLRQVLNLLKWLAPLAGLIVIAFTIALFPKLPALLEIPPKAFLTVHAHAPRQPPAFAGAPAESPAGGRATRPGRTRHHRSP